MQQQEITGSFTLRVQDDEYREARPKSRAFS